MTIRCRRCQVQVNLSSPCCECSHGIPDIRVQNNSNSDYESLYNEIAESDIEESMQPQELKTAKASDDVFNLRKLLHGKSNLKILEIGPGSGELARELAPYGSVYLLDITSKYLEKLSFATGRFVGNIETIPFYEEFDLIVLCDVLEHVLNEGDALLSIQSALRLGGAVYLRCPSNEPLVSYAQLLGSKYAYVHLRTYSRKSMRRALEFAGLHVVKSKYSQAIPIGFARRNFGVKRLRLARANRFTAEIRFALSGRGTLPRAKGLDFVGARLEAVSWKIADVVRIKKLRGLTATFWYQPSEVWAIGRKNLQLELTNSQDRHIE